MVAVLFELPSGSVLVIESRPFEAPERFSRVCIKLVVGSALETGREHMAQEQVIMRVNRHLVLVLMEVLDRVGHSRVALETQHHSFFEKR